MQNCNKKINPQHHALQFCLAYARWVFASRKSALKRHARTRAACTSLRARAAHAPLSHTPAGCPPCAHRALALRACLHSFITLCLCIAACMPTQISSSTREMRMRMRCGPAHAQAPPATRVCFLCVLEHARVAARASHARTCSPCARSCPCARPPFCIFSSSA